MNIWHFSGRLGRDAELRTTQGGDQVLGFAVANDVGFGERKTTQWIDCSVWGNRAEKLAPYLTKGTEVSVAGEVTLREITRGNGEKDKVLSVRVIEISLHGGQRNGQQTDAAAGNGRPNGQAGGNGQNAGNGAGGRANGSQGGRGGSDRQGGQARQAGNGGRAPAAGGNDKWDDEIPF